MKRQDKASGRTVHSNMLRRTKQQTLCVHNCNRSVGVLYASAWEDSKLPVSEGVCSPKKATNCWGNDRAQTIHDTEYGKSSWLLLLSAGLSKVGFADASIGVEQTTEDPTRSVRNIRFDCIVAAKSALAMYGDASLAMQNVSPAKHSNLVGGRKAKD